MESAQAPLVPEPVASVAFIPPFDSPTMKILDGSASGRCPVSVTTASRKARSSMPSVVARRQQPRRLREIRRRRWRRLHLIFRLNNLGLQLFRQFFNQAGSETDDQCPDKSDMQNADTDQDGCAPRGICRGSWGVRPKVVDWLFHRSSVAYTKLIPAQRHRDWRIWAKYASPPGTGSFRCFFLKANVITSRTRGLVFQRTSRM